MRKYLSIRIEKPKSLYAKIISILVFSLLLLSSVLITNSPFLTCFGTLFPSSKSVSDSILVQIPEMAEGLEYDVRAHTSGRGCTIWTEFSISSLDLNIVLESTDVTDIQQNQDVDEHFIRRIQEIGWEIQPDYYSGTAFYNVALGNNGTSDQLIFVNKSDIDDYLIYVIVIKNWI